MSAQESMYDRWNEAVQKFDYYMVGIVGAGVILLLRDLKIEHVAFNSDTVRAGGVFFLLASFLAGLFRLEQFHLILRLEHERLKRAPYRDAVKAGNTNIVREETYERMTPEEVKEFERSLDKAHSAIQVKLDRVSRGAGTAYALRNWCLVAGLLLLFAGAFIPNSRLPASPATPSLPLPPAPVITPPQGTPASEPVKP
jgi:hypothetical protein